MKKQHWTAGILIMCMAASVWGCQKEKPAAVTEPEPAVESSAEEVSSTEEVSITEEVSSIDGDNGQSKPVQEEVDIESPPELILTDPLSGKFNEFSITSGNYSWNYQSDKGIFGGETVNLVACGMHPLQIDAETAKPLYVPAYNQMERPSFTISCSVMPDRILLTGWSRMALGNTEASAERTDTYEAPYMIELEAGMVYGLTAVWEESKLEERGFYGEAEYVFWTEGETAKDGISQSEALVISGMKQAEQPEGMVLYGSVPFTYGETEWELQKLVPEDMLIEGELAMDDRGRFLIQAVSNGDSYVLFNEAVQLGEPEADVWIDTENCLHITLRDVRTARYQITDFVYSKEAGGTEASGEFRGRIVMDGDGINYLGATGQ